MLAGPNPVTTDGSLSDWVPRAFSSAWWMPDIGLAGWCIGAVGIADSYRYAVCQYDGYAFSRNIDSATPYGLAFSKINRALAIDNSDSNAHALEPLTGAVSPAVVCATYPVDPVCEWDNYMLVLHSGGRYLYRTDIGEGLYGGAGSALLHDFGAVHSAYPAWMSEGGPSSIWVCNANGWAVGYDLAAGAETDVFAVPASIDRGGGLSYTLAGMWFDKGLQVFIAYYAPSESGGHGAVIVYSTETIPSSLSNPAASPAVTQGRVSTVSVALTGDRGEPCPGFPVDWTASAGALFPAQSATGADGTATTSYAAPLSTGSATITATVAA